MKLKDLLGRVDKRKSDVLSRAKFEQKNKARKVVGKPALETIEKRVFPSLERVLRFPSNLWSWLTSSPAYAPQSAPIPDPDPTPDPTTAAIQFSAVPASGTWRLDYNEINTDPLDFDISAEDLQVAIRELEGLEDVVVTGNFEDSFSLSSESGADFSELAVVSNQLLDEDENPIIASVELP
jgi:hypothetical protein